MSKARFSWLVCLFVLLAVSPSSTAYGEGNPSEPGLWTNLSGAGGSNSWWKEFNDKNLNMIVERASQNNHDLKAATLKIAASTALANRSRSPLLPMLSLNSQGLMGPFDSLGLQTGGIPTGPKTPPDLYYSGSASLNLSYRLDSWAEEYMALKSNRLLEKASHDDRQAMNLLIVCQIIEAYYNAVASNEQLHMIKKQIATSQKLTDLVFRRYQSGSATALAVLQQRQQLAATKANLPQTNTLFQTSLKYLLILQGLNPSGSSPLFAETLPVLSALPEQGNLHTFLSKRPDLRALRNRTNAASERARSARWSHFPSIQLSTNAGYETFKGVTTNSQFFWNAGVVFSLPLFSGLADMSYIQEAEANNQAMKQSLKQQTLQAQKNMESAWIQEEGARSQLVSSEEQFKASAEAFTESKRQYIAGLIQYLDVLASLNTMQRAELGVVVAKRNLIGTRIRLYQVLGGSWR